MTKEEIVAEYSASAADWLRAIKAGAPPAEIARAKSRFEKALYTLLLFCLPFSYAERYLAPHYMAEMRRRRGDPAASPRDYDCQCPVPRADGLPDCWPHRAECRFRHLLRPRPKNHCNRFAYHLARRLWLELAYEWLEMSDEKRDALSEKADALDRVEKRRRAAIAAEPRPAPPPLAEGWTEAGTRIG